MLEITNTLSPTNVDETSNKINSFISKCMDYFNEQNYTIDKVEKLDKAQIIAEIKSIHSNSDMLLKSVETRKKSGKIIACTIDGYCANYDLKFRPYHIFLDEAGYSNIAKTLCLFATSSPITLLGDHMQLPPVCEANDDNFTRNITEMEDVFLWSQSSVHIYSFFKENQKKLLHNYLYNVPPAFNNIAKANLTKSFRFSQNLAEVLDDYVYKNGFSSANEKSTTQIIVRNATNTCDQEKRSNIAEVDEIAKIIKELDTDDYVILTPYKKQVSLLNSKLKLPKKENRVSTVHASQGKEWDTVILSVVDTDNMWFTNSCIEQTRVYK